MTSSFSEFRERGVKILETCGFSDTETSSLEAMVNSRSNGDSVKYKNTMMEIYDFVFQSGFDFEQISKIIDNDEVAWNNVEFKDIADAQAEIFSYIENPFEVVEGMFSCPKCGNKKNVTYSKQVRSSDEGMSTFVFCSNRTCRHSWVYQG